MKAAIIIAKRKNPKAMVEDADESILNELIGNCEHKISSKFKKAEPEPEEIAEETDDEQELDDDQIAALLDAYKKKLKA